MAHDAILLLTRPQAASERFAHLIRQALGPIDVVIAPVMDIVFEPLPPQAAQAKTTLFTSMNGVEAWARAGFESTEACYCVGPATATAARALGFDAIASAGDLAHMLPDVLAAAPPEPMVHIHGRHKRGDLVGALQAAGHSVEGCIGYDQRLLPLSETALDILLGDRPVIVPLFSPRSAAHFREICPMRAKPLVIAISQNAARCWPGATISRRPDAQCMLIAIKQALRGI